MEDEKESRFENTEYFHAFMVPRSRKENIYLDVEGIAFVGNSKNCHVKVTCFSRNGEFDE